MNSPLRLVLAFVLSCTLYFTTSAQSVAINTDGSTANASSILDIKSTLKGVLVPRMSKTEKNAIASPATGLFVFQNGPDSIGFHYYDGSKWIYVAIGNADSTSWKIGGNGNITSANFIGTTNDSAVRFKIKNIASGILDSTSNNTSLGFRSLQSFTTTGKGNSAFGYKSMLTNTTGTFNTAMGYQAGYLNDTASNNVSIGFQANYYSRAHNNLAVGAGAATYVNFANSPATEMTSVGTDAGQGFYYGSKSTAIGYRALYNHLGGTIYGSTTGRNTAIGDSAMAFASGESNVAVGVDAMSISYSGSQNIAIGDSSMGASQNSSGNVAVGYRTLTRTIAGYPNTAIGYMSQDSMTTGYANTSLGSYALGKNKQGTNNTAIGNGAMYEAVNPALPNYTFDNTAVGNDALRFTRYYGQTAMGAGALHSDTSGVYNTAIGYVAMNLNLRGNSNTAVGTSALRYDTSGSSNTAIGVNAMISHKNGDLNVAVGLESLTNDIDGGANTAIGTSSMYSHKTNGVNTAVGFESMYFDTAGSYNAAIGYRSLRYTKVGFENTALGVGAIEFTDSSYYNTAVGRGAMFQKGGTYNTSVGYYAAGEGSGTPTTKYYTVGTTNIGARAGFKSKGDENTFVGYYAGAGYGTDTLKGIENTGLGSYTLVYTTTGKSNTAMGIGAQFFNTTGSGNVSAGTRAMQNNTTGNGNTAIGDSAMYNNGTGSGNTVIGYLANTSISNWSNASAIGNRALVGASNSMVLGSISGTNGATASTSVGIGTTVPSSAKLQVLDNISPSRNTTYISGNNSTSVSSDGGTLYVENLVTTGSSSAAILAENENTTAGLGYGIYARGQYALAGEVTARAVPNATGTRALYLRNNTTNTGTQYGADILNAAPNSSTNYGVYTSATGGLINYGTYSFSNNAATDNYGVYGTSSGGTTFNVGTYGSATGASTTNYGVYGSASGATNNYSVYCSGSGGYTGTWTNVSDRMFKKDVQDVSSNTIDKIMALKPVSYLLKADEYKNFNFPTFRQFGFVAQDMEKVFPTLVENASHPAEDKDAAAIQFKAVNYIGLIPVLTKAMQEQQAMIEKQAKENEELKAKNDQLEKDIQLIKTKLGL